MIFPNCYDKLFVWYKFSMESFARFNDIKNSWETFLPCHSYGIVFRKIYCECTCIKYIVNEPDLRERNRLKKFQNIIKLKTEVPLDSRVHRTQYSYHHNHSSLSPQTEVCVGASYGSHMCWRT